MNGWSRYQRGKSVGEENERKNEGESPAVGKENLEMDGASGKGGVPYMHRPRPSSRVMGLLSSRNGMK